MSSPKIETTQRQDLRSLAETKRQELIGLVDGIIESIQNSDTPPKSQAPFLAFYEKIKTHYQDLDIETFIENEKEHKEHLYAGQTLTKNGLLVLARTARLDKQIPPGDQQILMGVVKEPHVNVYVQFSSLQQTALSYAQHQSDVMVEDSSPPKSALNREALASLLDKKAFSAKEAKHFITRLREAGTAPEADSDETPKKST